MSDYLPREIWEEILHRQTLKSLVKCTSICKELKSMITNLDFISDHIDRTVQVNGDQPLFLLRQCRKTGKRSRGKRVRDSAEFSYSLLLDNEQFDLVSTLGYPFKDRFLTHSLIGTCNGLVLLADDMGGCGNTLILWNPSIRKYLVLPEPTVTFRTHGDYDTCLGFGFGFDSKTKDFRVVRLADYSESSKVEVYSLAGGCWKSICDKAPSFILPKIVFMGTNHMFMNGALHWVVRRRGTHDRFILTLDVFEETFGELMLPESLHKSDEMVYVLAGGESLAVVNSTYPISYTKFTIWVMKEYGIVESWTKVFNYASTEHGILTRPLGFRKNGEVVLQNHSGEILSVDPVTELVKNLGVRGDGYAFFHHHVESLSLLHQKTDVTSY